MPACTCVSLVGLAAYILSCCAALILLLLLGDIASSPRQVLTAWYEVQRALLDCQQDDVVKTGHAFHSYTEDSEGVTVTFENGNQKRSACILLPHVGSLTCWLACLEFKNCDLVR